MLLWVVLAALTAVAALAVLAPLSRARGRTTPGGHDTAVYRDQLAEIERDLERGLIAPVEAEAARTEIARRLIKAADGEVVAASAGPATRRLAAAFAVLGIPAIALGLYLTIGQPDLPDQPLAARLAAAPDTQSIDTLVGRVEAHLAKNPEDGQGWDVVAPVYMRLSRYADAAAAYRNAIRILGSTARRQAGLGEALTVIAGGVVTADARAAFEAAVAADPANVPARMYLALALSQGGRRDDSIAAWKTLIADARGGEPWLDTARAELAKLDPASVPPAPALSDADAAAPGPSRGETAAAAEMGPDEGAKMVEGMVARLSERLAAGGGTVDEWARLIRSLAVLGRAEEARAALGKAREALRANEADLARIDELAKGLAL